MYVYVSYILISILESGPLCAYWNFSIDNTYVFNDSFLITFLSDGIEEHRGFVLSYVERKDNTTEAHTSMKPEVETTTHIELSTTQQSTSNTETTTDELSTTQLSTSNTETTTDELSTTQQSTSNTETTTDELSTTQQSTSNTETTTDELSTAQYSTSTVHICM